MCTYQEKIDFGKVKAGYGLTQTPIQFIKPKTGCLLLIENSKTTVIKNDLPFNLLQSLKIKLIKQNPYYKGKLKIKYKSNF